MPFHYFLFLLSAVHEEFGHSGGGIMILVILLVLLLVVVVFHDVFKTLAQQEYIFNNLSLSVGSGSIYGQFNIREFSSSVRKCS